MTKGAVGARFVGRERELTAVHEALTGGSATVVAIEGEAGVGKTRLVREVLAGLPAGAGVLEAACPPFRVPFTLGPVVDALRASAPRVGGLRLTGLTGLAGALRPLFPDWADALPPSPEPLHDARAARHRLFGALVELLGRVDVSILVVEDAHWADDATAEFLLYLAAQRVRPVSVVVTYRPEDVPADSLLRQVSGRYAQVRCGLEPLGVTATTTLISSVLDGERVSPAFGAFLHRHTGGLPLEVEEVVRLMRERADLVCFDGEWMRRELWEIVVPPTVRDTVLERAGRRSAAALAVLHAASVLDMPSPAAAVLAVADLPPDRSGGALAEAVTSGLLQEDARGLLACRHALAARALYASVPTTTRQAMHRRAAGWLRAVDPEPLAPLAHHYRAAGDVEAWCRYAERAADQALASADETSAAVLLHGVIVGAELPAATLVRLVPKLPYGGFTGSQRHRDLVDAVRAAVAREDRGSPAAAQLHYVLGRVLIATEMDDRSGRTEIRRALPHLPPDSDQSLSSMSLLAIPRGAESGAAHRYWAERARHCDKFPAAGLRVAALLLLGEPDGWTELTALLRAGAAQDGEQTLLQANAATCAATWGRYRVARQLFDAARGRAERAGYPRISLNIMGNEAHLDYRTGAWDGLAQRVSTLVGDADLQPMARTSARFLAALLAASTGADVPVEAELRDVLDSTLALGATESLPSMVAGLAGWLLAAGRAAEAVESTGPMVRTIDYKRVWLWGTDVVPARVEALVRTGQVTRAAELVARFDRGLRDLPAPAPHAGLALARAVLAQATQPGDRAARLFDRAAAAWSALPRPYDAWLARERQGHCLVAAGQVGAGRDLLADVRSGLVELGARPAADRVAAALATGTPRRSRGRPAYGDELSPREVEVVRLLLDGRTNREIAGRLAVSPRTVDSHVRSAMRKVQVSSRTALALRAVELGIAETDTK